MTSDRALCSALLGLLVAVAPGCGAFGYRFQSPITRDVEEVRFGPAKLTAAEVQSEVMSFTDTFNAAVAEHFAIVQASDPFFASNAFTRPRTPYSAPAKPVMTRPS